jgi:hypothetical protein
MNWMGYHVANELMNPPTKGLKTGPRKGASVQNIIGFWISAGTNKSATVPAATLKNALPAIPSRNLPTSMVCIFCAAAEGIMKTRKKKTDRI